MFVKNSSKKVVCCSPEFELKSKWEELELATDPLSHFSAGEAAV